MLQNKPSGIAHIAIPTDEPEEMRAFYQSLGFTSLVDGGIRGMLQCGSCVIEYYPRRCEKKPIGNIDHVALTCDNLDQAYEEVKEMGYQMISNGIESNQMFAPKSNRYFIFLGPNGEKIEFCKIG